MAKATTKRGRAAARPTGDPSPWLTVKEAAARAKFGEGAIYAAVRRGKLKAVRVGTALRIHVTWLDAWLDAGATMLNADAPGPTLVYEPRR
jgi:excisionase family DNA binding protein